MILLGVLAVAVLATLVFGLITKRIDWRQQGCCAPADPSHDLRMRGAETTPSTTTRRREP